MEGKKNHGLRTNKDHANIVKARNNRAGNPGALVIRNRKKKK